MQKRSLISAMTLGKENQIKHNLKGVILMFDPSKHRKTTEKLATLQNTSQLVWKIDKPKKKDYVRIYGNSLDDLANTR